VTAEQPGVFGVAFVEADQLGNRLECRGFNDYDFIVRNRMF
jgi:hypothetical protein